jgi:hypothetical protein
VAYTDQQVVGQAMNTQLFPHPNEESSESERVTFWYTTGLHEPQKQRAGKDGNLHKKFLSVKHDFKFWMEFWIH